MVQQILMDSVSGLVIASVTAVMSFLLGVLRGRTSIHDRYYKYARDDLKRLIVDIANVINSAGADGFKQKHKNRILSMNSGFWNRHMDSLRFFLHHEFSSADVARARFETALLNTLNKLLPEAGPGPGNLGPINTIFQGEVVPSWKALFGACFPAANLRDHERARLEQPDYLKIRKGPPIPHFKN